MSDEDKKTELQRLTLEDGIEGLGEAGEYVEEIRDKASAVLKDYGEKLITAFMAETGLSPSECEIVQRIQPGEIVTFVQRRELQVLPAAPLEDELEEIATDIFNSTTLEVKELIPLAVRLKEIAAEFRKAREAAK